MSTHAHTYILAKHSANTQALQFCNSRPPCRCVCLFGSNHGKKRSSSAKPRRQTEGERNYQTDGGWTESMMMHDDAEMRAAMQCLDTRCDHGTVISCNFEDQIYLFLPLSSPPHGVVTCTHTPGGLLTAQRPLSAWVSSSRTPPLLPEMRTRVKVSHISQAKSLLFAVYVCRHACSLCPSASLKRRSAVTDDSFINQFIQKRQLCLAV